MERKGSFLVSKEATVINILEDLDIYNSGTLEINGIRDDDTRGIIYLNGTTTDSEKSHLINSNELNLKRYGKLLS